MIRAGFGIETPPPIPASHTGTEWLRGLHLLLWVHTGSAHVHLESGQVHRLASGQGIWVPADSGRRVSTDPGSLAFPYPITPDTVSAAPTEPVRFAIRDEWRDWLILHYAHLVTPITSLGYTQTTLLDVLGATESAPRSSSATQGPHDYPPMPIAAGARTVAEELLRNPALDYTAEEWATLVACAARTLRRDFLRGTGMTFAHWRNRCRLTAACEFLAAGYDVGHAAIRAGFASRSGFTRAFREYYGTTPREYVARSPRPNGTPARRVTAARQSGMLAHLLADGGQGVPAARRPLPVTQTAPHVNDVHVLTWMYRGTGYVRVDGKTYPRREGDAAWIPAGVEHQAGTLENSLGLPLGYLDPADVHFAEPFRAHFPSSWDTYLLHCSVSACTRLRPEGYNRRHILDVFRGQLAAQRARTAPMPRDVRARTAALQFLRRMEEPSTSALDPVLHEVFRRETGLTFANWRQATRMRVARDLLANGAKPTSVARQVGYTQTSNFSRAFSRFHGLSPREYREQENTPAR